jgi:hypothetical protein
MPHSPPGELVDVSVTGKSQPLAPRIVFGHSLTFLSTYTTRSSGSDPMMRSQSIDGGNISNEYAASQWVC